MSKRIDPKFLPAQLGTFYPPPYDQPCRARERRKLGDAAGLTPFGVNLLRLKPGGWSRQRHWHTEQDEFVYIVSGEVGLVTHRGENQIVVALAQTCQNHPNQGEQDSETCNDIARDYQPVLPALVSHCGN